jgi:hypothetical protein
MWYDDSWLILLAAFPGLPATVFNDDVPAAIPAGVVV